MSDTPRTDDARLSIYERIRFANRKGVMYELVPANFARQLERELAEARADAVNDRLIVETVYQHEKAAIERAERAEAECAGLREVIRRAANIMAGGEGVTDQGDAWDKAPRLLDASVAEFDVIDAARKP